MSIEQILLMISAVVLLLVVIISFWAQREHVVNEARLRILGNAHSHRDLMERMQSIVDSIYCEIPATNVTIIAYTSKEKIVHATSNIKPIPMMSAKEARSLDAEVQTGIIDVKRLPERSFVAKMLTSYHIRYLLPLDHHEERFGYIVLEVPKRPRKLKKTYMRILASCQKDVGDALSSAVNTFITRSLNDVLHQHVHEASHTHDHAMKTLDELDTAKDEFVSMASHQLRTPLTSIKGYISMLLEGDAGELKPEQKKLLSEAFLSSEQMVNLIGDYLNVSRIQTGKFLIDMEAVDLVKMTKQEAKRLSVSAKTRGIKINVDVPVGEVSVYADEAKIRQVILNFIDNAIYYSPENSTIDVKLSDSKNAAIVTVKDQGIGVPIDEQAKLFQKFFRASNARTHRPDGNGIGLFLAKQIIDGHKGKIVFSSTPDKGSTFGFALPKE